MRLGWSTAVNFNDGGPMRQLVVTGNITLDGVIDMAGG